jgi:hypothetical protein
MTLRIDATAVMHAAAVGGGEFMQTVPANC